MLLEFRSLTKEEEQQQHEKAGPSLFPDMNFRSTPPPEGESSDLELGGLADELEGPDPVAAEDSSSVASWFRGLIPR